MKITIFKNIFILTICASAIITIPMTATSCSEESNIKYFAHRGLSSEYFENTRESFQAAANNKNFDGIETDVYLTKDYNIVCSHAKDPFRVIVPDQSKGQNSIFCKDGYDYNNAIEYDSGTGYIYQNTYSETIHREIWTGVETWNGNGYEIERDDPNEYGFTGTHYLPSFNEYLNICNNANKTPVIEIKNDIDGTGYNWTDINQDSNSQYYGKPNIDILVDAIKSADQWNANTNILCFYRHIISPQLTLYDKLREIEGSDANVPLIQELIWEEGNVDQTQAALDVYEQINKRHNVSVGYYFTKNQIADMVLKAHRKGLQFGVWTINNRDEQKQVIKAHVDSITTNFVLQH